MKWFWEGKSETLIHDRGSRGSTQTVTEKKKKNFSNDRQNTVYNNLILRIIQTGKPTQVVSC